MAGDTELILDEGLLLDVYEIPGEGQRGLEESRE